MPITGRSLVQGAGELRHRLAIQSATETRDAIGGVTKSWATVATRWGSIRPLSGQELVSAQQASPRVSHKITIRYYSGLTPAFRLQNDSRTFNISSILNIIERDKIQVILAEQVI